LQQGHLGKKRFSLFNTFTWFLLQNFELLTLQSAKKNHNDNFHKALGQNMQRKTSDKFDA
jgi:hypothetical protein